MTVLIEVEVCVRFPLSELDLLVKKHLVVSIPRVGETLHITGNFYGCTVSKVEHFAYEEGPGDDVFGPEDHPLAIYVELPDEISKDRGRSEEFFNQLVRAGWHD